MSKKPISTQQQAPKTLALCIRTPYHRKLDPTSYAQEFANLIKTNRLSADLFETVKVRSVDPSYFLTKGKRAEIKQLIDQEQIEEIIVSEPLTARQERNLSDYFGQPVFDRTQLILEIFEKAAISAEGKLQVQIAILEHDKSRLAGKGIHLAQQAGHTGVIGGPGETLKERQTRYIEDTIYKLKKQLARLEQARKTQRKRRLAQKVPQICLIGYTNAGKSTILNALTKADVLAEDKLFATLDTTTRELYVNGSKVGIITDTVGFIQNLPHQLIESFKSTLSELQYADLLLHVVDCSDQNAFEHIKTVNAILYELSVDKPVLYIFNKADRLTRAEQLEALQERFTPHVVTRATDPEGLRTLLNFLRSWKPIPQANAST